MNNDNQRRLKIVLSKSDLGASTKGSSLGPGAYPTNIKI